MLRLCQQGMGVKSVSSAPGQPLQALPLLAPKAPAVIPPLLHLIAYASWVEAPLEIGSAKQHVPPGQQHAKVGAAQLIKDPPF